MTAKSCLSDEIENNISERNFNELNSNFNSHSNSIFLSITHNTQIINNNNNVNFNNEDSFLNLLDINLKKSKKIDYKQFYYEVKKLVMEESLSENEYEIYAVLNKVKEMVKIVKQLKKKGSKNMENELGENIEQQSDIKNKSTKKIKIDTIDNINKDKKLSIKNFSYNCATNDILPELLSPKDNYKIFINSIKQFEYEEKIYDKYLTHDDLKILKSFPEKLKKYLAHLETSLEIAFVKL
jgi:hypothetical protein